VTKRYIALAALLIAGCTSTADSATTIDVVSTDAECEMSSTSAAEGAITFSVTNDGGSTTEFYLYAADGSTIVGEVEDIGPGLTRSFAVAAEAGVYVTACKPGMTGDGIRAEFEVTSS